MTIALIDRTVLRCTGENVTDWLSGLITNNLTEEINFAALLTPQGKIIADFFVVKDKDSWLIDVSEKYADMLVKRLSMYKLRAKINIAKTDLCVFAAWDGTGDEGFSDPRDTRLGRRIYGQFIDTEADLNDYNMFRLRLGIPDSHWDFDTQDIFPANANMDRLNGVDFKKGCFVGQEVVSRMYRKTDVKKRMIGFKSASVSEDTTIKANERVVGEVMHYKDGYGMAMIRLDRLPTTDLPLLAGDITIDLMELPNGN